MELGYPVPGENSFGDTRAMILDWGDALLRTRRIWGNALSEFTDIQTLATPENAMVILGKTS